MTRLTCPNCGQAYDLDIAEVAQIYDERSGFAARLGAAWKLANEYVDCFRAEKGARVNLKKRVRILAEICTLWEKRSFMYDGKRYRVEEREIIEALRTVCNADKCGFQNHNYLKKVLTGTAQRVSAEGLTAKEENTRHVSRRDAEPAEEIEDKISLEEAMKRRGLGQLATGMLKGME
jgi:hypothetical protein